MQPTPKDEMSKGRCLEADGSVQLLYLFGPRLKMRKWQNLEPATVRPAKSLGRLAECPKMFETRIQEVCNLKRLWRFAQASVKPHRLGAAERLRWSIGSASRDKINQPVLKGDQTTKGSLDPRHRVSKCAASPKKKTVVALPCLFKTTLKGYPSERRQTHFTTWVLSTELIPAVFAAGVHDSWQADLGMS